MKQRIGTAVVLFAVLALCIWQVYTPIMTAVVAFLAAMSAFEIMRCAKVQNMFILVLGTAFAAFLPFISTPSAMEGIVAPSNWGKFVSAVPAYIYIIGVMLLFCVAMLFDYEKTSFQNVAVASVASVFVPLIYSCIIRLRDMFAGDERQFGVYLIFFALISSLGTDAGAQLGGMAFGKHKLCPQISPKKTVEGAISGVIFAYILNVAAFFIYRAVGGFIPAHALAVVLICSVPLSLASMAGDLTASVLKRNFGIKDFGKIFPGHGGVMDRFDSSLFTVVLTFAVASMVF